jgi:hypothetical protein
MSKPTFTVLDSRVRRNELAGALINPDTGLSSAVLMEDAAGAKFFLPVYRSATQTTGGRQTFAPSLEDDGTLTFYLEAGAPPAIAAQVGAARPYVQGISFWLVLNPNGAATRIPLAAVEKDNNNIWRLSAKLAGGARKAASDALFDQSPNVAIEILQSLKVGAPLTQQFVKDNWSDPAILKGLFATFAGIGFDEASSFYTMALKADRDYPNEYMRLDCTYSERISAPPLPGYIQWQVNWGDRAFNYYQDNQERNRVFYLPDKFHLAKGPTNAPTVSLLQFTLPAGESSVEKTRATFRVYGEPVVQFARIEDAKRVLATKIGLVPTMVSIQDAHRVGKTFTQSLPNAAGTGSNPSLQNSATVDFVAGVRNELDLNFQQFLAVWAAIFSTAAENPIFRGWIDVQLLDGKYTDRIDFDGRIPKEQEKVYFDDILDTSREIIYSTSLMVSTLNQIFKAQPADKQVVALELTFGSKVIALSESPTKDSVVKGSVVIERSIRDIVLGGQTAAAYDYSMRVVRANGTMTCCAGKAGPSLWVMETQIAACTGDCDG